MRREKRYLRQLCVRIARKAIIASCQELRQTPQSVVVVPDQGRSRPSHTTQYVNTCFVLMLSDLHLRDKVDYKK